MNPEFLNGDILLSGPVASVAKPDSDCLKAIYRDSDSDPANGDAEPNNDTVPPNFFISNSFVSAFGTGTVITLCSMCPCARPPTAA